MYQNGEGVKQDYVEAMRWYKLAAEQGFYLAQYDIGEMYYSGKGVQQDFKVAYYWFYFSAKSAKKYSNYNYRESNDRLKFISKKLSESEIKIIQEQVTLSFDGD